MAFWWVNHKQTRDHEVRDHYLWSPQRNANNSTNASYEAMTRVRPSDLVFSYANGVIGAIGRVAEPASAAPKPTEFGRVGDYWANEGWLVGVDFVAVPKPLKPKANPAQRRSAPRTAGSPARRAGSSACACVNKPPDTKTPLFPARTCDMDSVRAGASDVGPAEPHAEAART